MTSQLFYWKGYLLSVPSEGVGNAPHDGGWFNELFQNVGLSG